RGGFELVSMHWKDGKIVKAVIKSTLGGNLRLRLPNQMKLSNGSSLKNAIGENKNPFYQTEAGAPPVLSPKATITAPPLKETFLYDILTQKGSIYILVSD
ncbi:MAG: glycoside hydrolase family 95-like protein, partial [Chitinophagaceae bacterium]